MHFGCSAYLFSRRTFSSARRKEAVDIGILFAVAFNIVVVVILTCLAPSLSRFAHQCLVPLNVFGWKCKRWWFSDRMLCELRYKPFVVFVCIGQSQRRKLEV